MVIWKYQLALEDDFECTMPKGAEILSVQLQGYGVNPQMWVRCDPHAPDTTVKLHCRGTGHPVNADWQHIGTVQRDPYVWHFFKEDD